MYIFTSKKGKRDSPNYSWKAINNLNLDYATVFSLAPYINEDVITIIGVCFLIGAMAKSAQVGGDKQIRRPIKDLSLFSLFRTLIYAGNISNTLESMSSNCVKLQHKAGLNTGVFLFDLVKIQRHGINQQGLYELNTMLKKKKLMGLNHKFLEWFIGFTEGQISCCFYIEKGKSCFSIHLNLVDLPVLIEIKTQLNIGTVNIHKKNAAEFRVNSPKEIGLLIEIFNGKFYLKNRQIQFEGWCKNYINKTQDIIELKSQTFKPSLNDSWLSGLFDGLGGFGVKVSTGSSNKVALNPPFYITQFLSLKQPQGAAEVVELKFLSTIINGKLLVRNRGYYKVNVYYSDASTMVEYFTQHKLYTIKSKSLEKWLEIYLHRINANTKVDYSLIKRNTAFINFNTKLSNIRRYSQFSKPAPIAFLGKKFNKPLKADMRGNNNRILLGMLNGYNGSLRLRLQGRENLRVGSIWETGLNEAATRYYLRISRAAYSTSLRSFANGSLSRSTGETSYDTPSGLFPVKIYGNADRDKLTILKSCAVPIFEQVRAGLPSLGRAGK
jgi:LAGLIDADG endonuclease